MSSFALLLVALGLVCVASAIVGGGLRLIGWIEVPTIGSFRRQIALGLFGAVVSVVGFSQYAGSGGAPEAKHAPSSPAPIKIDQGHPQVPRCATFGGQGVVPVNKTLWLAVLGPGLKYYFFGPVNIDRHGWILRDVNVGRQDTPPGTKFMISAVLVDNATNELLQRNRPLRVLPDNSYKVDQIEVKRSGENTACK